MKIALVRGFSLTPWELQSYEPLRSRCELTWFAATRTPLWGSSTTTLPIERCFWWDSAVEPLGKNAAWLLNGLCSRLLGFNYHLQGLEDKLRGYDIIHSLETHNTFSYQSLLAKRRYGSKLVLTVWETIPFRGESHPLRTFRKRRVLAEADAFMAISQRTRQMLITEGVPDVRIHVIPMGIDCARFAPLSQEMKNRRRQRLGLAPGDFVILCVARLVPEKGVYDLIEALAQMRCELPSLSLKVVFAGQGPERKALEVRAAERQLLKQIVFAGAVPYAEMPEVFGSVDCLALPSRPTRHWEEQFGFALVEAMAAGLPVVSTHSGAIPEVVGDAGLLISPGHPAELAQALGRLVREPDLRRQLGQRGRQRALACFSGPVVADKLYQMYLSI